MTDQTATTQGTPHLSDADFEKTITEAGMPVFVDFYAEWCGPCKQAAPIVDKLAVEYKGKVLVAKVDVDVNIEVARKYGVMSIPTVLVFNKVGEEVKVIDRKVGFPGEAVYREMLNKASGAAAPAASKPAAA